jgi:hypothetical protein
MASGEVSAILSAELDVPGLQVERRASLLNLLALLVKKYKY